MKSFPLKAGLAAAWLAACGVGWAAPTWITIGDQAHALLPQVAPNARTLASRQVAVSVPSQRGSATLVAAREGVHVVEIDDGMLPTLSLAVHRSQRKCGGFVRHESMAQALAVLHRIDGAPEQLATPSYAIDNRALVDALLPQLQASNILSTISQLSAFQNRRYNSTHGVAASTWLFNQWMPPRRACC